MPTVWIAAPLRELTAGKEIVTASGSTVRQVIESLNAAFPGITDRLCDGDELRSGIAVAVDSEIARLGLLQPVSEKSEVHFLPAIGGGQ